MRTIPQFPRNLRTRGKCSVSGRWLRLAATALAVGATVALPVLFGLLAAQVERASSAGGPTSAFGVSVAAAQSTDKTPAAVKPQTGAAGTGTAYVANEKTGTVSVIDVASGLVTGTICLGSDKGDDIPGTPGGGFSTSPCDAESDFARPFYDGHYGTHGLWLTPDGSILLVANRLSGTVVAIDTTVPCLAAGCAEAILGYAPVGREPHLATVRPGAKEAWVAVRGESYVQVLRLDPDDLRRPGLLPTERMKPVESIYIPPLGLSTAAGPSMVTFTSDGKYAFVANGKSPGVHKIQASSGQRVVDAVVPAQVPFTPFGLVTPDDQELYLVHKAVGRISILRTSDLQSVLTDAAGNATTLSVGPCANHVAFVGKLAYVTVGGEAPCAPAGNANREGKIVIVDRTSHKVVKELTGSTWTGDPHGIWATPLPAGSPAAAGPLLYIGHESGDRVTVLDTKNPDDPTDDEVVKTISDSGAAVPYMRQPVDVVIKR